MSERLDTESMPLTEPHWPPTFDTGPHPQPLATAEPVDDPWRGHWSDDVDEAAREKRHLPAIAHPILVPGQYQYLKRWQFVVVLLGVWFVAAAAGAGCYYSWFHSIDKTWPDFAVLTYVLGCVVAALLVSLIEHKPTVSATAVAVMSAPFASGVAAAAMYGMYVFGWVTP